MGIVQQIKPDIVMRLMFARHVDRIFTTIQISDTGISPGSELDTSESVSTNKPFLFRPGCGSADRSASVTIASNTVELLVKQLRREEQAFYEIIAEMGEQDQRLINEV